MRIKRDIINKFKDWKDADKHKPILLKGARQIGKTWAMEEFGTECFDYTAKFDFDRQKELKSAFTVSKEPARIIRNSPFIVKYLLFRGRHCSYSMRYKNVKKHSTR